ncbi:BON domain-containing protein [Alkalimonas sp.]|uniref:BON domain-containing protein n=1 Tax=Alkalimonas sp. TaxID=1872453 RepID=UPI00263BCC5B|nr:BON domain-containing protein [Alkalimonas sp.]MCC5827550.1 BON domain-containing protein [Alkalimonas sp.]
MKLHHTFYTLLLALPLVAVTACDNRAPTSSTQPKPMSVDESRTYRQVDDNSLNRDVSNALQRDTAFARNTIKVAANKGHITLTGTVASMQDKNRAAEIAKEVTGVIEVHNNLEINLATVGY